MQRLLFSSTFLLIFFFACKSETEQPSVQKTTGCQPGKDTINLLTTFKKDTDKTPTDRFYSIVSFITNKGFFKPQVQKNGKLMIEEESSKTFPVVYDSCNMTRWITKNFIMENINVATIKFSATRADKKNDARPRLYFQEWKFANNTDRDSAMKIIRTAYSYPNNMVAYFKHYSQFIMDDKRILILQTFAKFSEPYAIEYRNLIEQFIRTQKIN